MSFLKPERGYSQCADFRTGAVQTSTNSRDLWIVVSNRSAGKTHFVRTAPLRTTETRLLIEKMNGDVVVVEERKM
jgi:hypothetical protein